MRRDELKELHYICPITNLASILENGILSHRRATRLPHRSIAKQDVQDKRARVQIPRGLALHEYANLYICGRNPTLLRMISNAGDAKDLCVLRVNTNVLDLAGTVITDQNAASEYRLFRLSPNGLAIVDEEMVFAEYWTHPDDQIQGWRHRSIKCAEVLVPNRIRSTAIMGAYVASEAVRDALAGTFPELPLQVDEHLFFMSR